MTPETVMTDRRSRRWMSPLLVAAPMLLVALVVGLVVSIFQAATQINEATLSFIPKLLGDLRRAGDRRAVDAVDDARLHAPRLHDHARDHRLSLAAMFSFTYAQLNAWLTAFLWPFVRILALIATAPVLGHMAVPMRVKIGARRLSSR